MHEDGPRRHARAPTNPFPVSASSVREQGQKTTHSSALTLESEQPNQNTLGLCPRPSCSNKTGSRRLNSSAYLSFAERMSRSSAAEVGRGRFGAGGRLGRGQGGNLRRVGSDAVDEDANVLVRAWSQRVRLGWDGWAYQDQVPRQVSRSDNRRVKEGELSKRRPTASRSK